MYDIVLGKSEQWAHRFVQGLPDRCKLSEPVGVWFTEFGQVNTGTTFLDKPFIVSCGLSPTSSLEFAFHFELF